MKQRSMTRRKARLCVLGCAALLAVSAGIACALILHANKVARQREETVRAAAQAAAEEQAAREEAAAQEARLEEERRQAEEAAAALRAQQLEAAAAARRTCNTATNWGPFGWKVHRLIVTSIGVTIPRSLMQAQDAEQKVTVCYLEKTAPYLSVPVRYLFADLGSAEIGDRIYLETDWGTFVYEVTEMQVIYETDIDKVRSVDEPSCILYTCYPFGILTHTDRRYAVYADPVAADVDGVIPQ